MRRPKSLILLMMFAACGGPALTSSPTPVRAAAPDLRGLSLPDSATVAIREQTADQQVVHALNRLAFGPRPGDVQQVRELGVDRWIALQMEPRRIPDSAGTALVARFPALLLPADELMRQYPPNPVLRRLIRANMTGTANRDSLRFTRDDTLAYREAIRQNRELAGALIALRVARAAASERQLEEVMVDFWLNHFSVYAGKGGAMRQYLVSYERDAIRPHALGNFRAMLGAVAKHPAMLHYLDNTLSVADSGRPTLAARPVALGGRAGARARRPMAAQASATQPTPMQQMVQRLQQRRRGLNENYARELMELHTLGVDGGYTQRDVTEAARVLTGWSIGRPVQGGTFTFNRLVHDAGEKTVLGTRFGAGGGLDEGERLLDMLAAHPSTAKYIAFKLVRRFVSDSPPAELVARAAATFTRTRGDIHAVMRTIVTSQEFFSSAAWRAKVKSPFEVVVSATRALGAAPDTTPRTAAVVARLGQGIFQHQAPNGWPETGDAWINTGAILNRINFGMAIASGAVPGVRLSAWPQYAALSTQPREQQVDAVVQALLGGTISTDMRTVLVSGAHPMLGAAQQQAVAGDTTTMRDPDGEDPGMAPMRMQRAPREGRAAAGVRFAGTASVSGLAQIIGLAIGSPEFQRR
jgi:uncharacterized protein (DUF1800 family)